MSTVAFEWLGSSSAQITPHIKMGPSDYTVTEYMSHTHRSDYIVTEYILDTRRDCRDYTVPKFLTDRVLSAEFRDVQPE